MDELFKAEMHEGSAYLVTRRGDVWRVWMGPDHPLIERALEWPPNVEKTLNLARNPS